MRYLGLIILCGKTCSGKDSVGTILCNKYGFHRVITVTSRPIRKGEKDGVTYHYLTEDEFTDLISKNEFAEWRKYETVEGVWYYGTKKKDLNDILKYQKNFIITTPSGYEHIKNNIPSGVKTMVVYLNANHSVIEKRLLHRGDNISEAKRRLASDDIDFKNFYNKADRTINNFGSISLDDIAEKINKYEETLNKEMVD